MFVKITISYILFMLSLFFLGSGMYIFYDTFSYKEVKEIGFVLLTLLIGIFFLANSYLQIYRLTQ